MTIYEMPINREDLTQHPTQQWLGNKVRKCMNSITVVHLPEFDFCESHITSKMCETNELWHDDAVLRVKDILCTPIRITQSLRWKQKVSRNGIFITYLIILQELYSRGTWTIRCKGEFKYFYLLHLNICLLIWKWWRGGGDEAIQAT